LLSQQNQLWTGRVQNRINDNGFSLLGVGDTAGKEHGLYAGLTGLLSTIYTTFLAYPIDGQGSANTIQAQRFCKGNLMCSQWRRVCLVKLSTEQRNGLRGSERLPSDYTACVEFLWHWAAALLDRRWIVTFQRVSWIMFLPHQSMFWFHSVDGREDDIRRMTLSSAENNGEYDMDWYSEVLLIIAFPSCHMCQCR
jgi:hypothetical protein